MNPLRSKSFILLVALMFSFAFLIGASNLTTQQIMNRSFDETTERLQIGIAIDSLKDSTALTNTVTYPLTLTHETSGTPAAGIGVGFEFSQETAASNDETVGGIAAVMTDVTSTSEDAKIVFYTMSAGAAMTEKFMIGPTETVANDASLDQDFRVESNGGTSAVFVDAGNDRVGIHTAAPTVPLEVTGNTLITGTVTSTGLADVLSVTLGNDETITNATNGQIDLNGNVYLVGAVKYKAACEIAADDATPDVAGCAFMVTSANTGATEITDLDNPVVGSIVYLLGGSATNSSTISDAGSFNLRNTWTADLDDVLILYVQADNDYVEIGRVNN